MTARESTQEQTQPQYMSKKVVINGQTVTLYSLNGVTWLSTPDQIPDTMARLDNTRILLHDPKAGEAAPAAVAPALAPKATAARYRMRGPKPRPILQPDGTLAPVIEREPVAATETQVQITHQEIQVVRDPKKDTRTAFSKHLDAKKGVASKVASEKGKLEKASRSTVGSKKAAPQKNSESSKSEGTKRAAKIVAPIAKASSAKKAPKSIAETSTKGAPAKKSTSGATSKKSSKGKK